MIIKNMKKILSGIVVATYLMIYVAPIGICSTAVPKLDAGVSKPALRGSEQPSNLKLEGDIALTKGNPKVSLSLRDSDVTQVLRMFADKAGLNIIFHQSVFGGGAAASSGSSSTGATAASGAPKITMDLVNVPLNDAFKMVLQIANLTYYVDHNTMVVISSTASQTLNLTEKEMMTIPVKYNDAAVLADFLNKNIFSRNRPGLSNAIIAITNPSTNEILIFGTKNDYLMAKKIVAQFDIKTREETFVVNHTTPAEMSALICSLLFRSFSGSTSANSTGAGSNGAGAAATNTTVLGATGNSSSAIALGAGVNACNFNNSVTAGALSSLNASSLAVTYFPQKGTINVRGGSAQQMDMIKEFIAKNDIKQPQAYLEVSIIELSESGSKEFTNTWNLYSNFFSGSFNGSLDSNPYFPSFVRNGNTLPGTGYTVYDSAANKFAPLYNMGEYTGVPTLSYAIHYLVQNGKGRVLSNPRILITNGQTSKIDLSSDYVKSVTSQVLTGMTAGAVQRTYTIGSDEGITVTLIPFISPDGYVTLNIQPNYATIKERVTTPNPSDPKVQDLQATLLQRRNLDLKNVRIKDGETLVIGGMIREDEQKTISKLPVLGDLPGIGAMFRNTLSTKSKQELVIMLTPKIVKDSEDIVKKQESTL